MLRDLFLGLKIHILHHAAHAPVFGLALIHELARHGYDVSPGTLYPILHEIECCGYFARQARVVHGEVRTDDRIMPLGTRVLAEARVKIAAPVAKVLRMEGPRSIDSEEDSQA